MSDNIISPLPTWVLATWILVTLFAPFADFYYTITAVASTMGSPIIYALLWAYIPVNINPDIGGSSILGKILPVDPGNVFYGFHIFNPAVMAYVPVFGFFTILFAFQLIRYVQDKTPLRKTIIAGLLTLAIPLYQIYLFAPYLLMIGHLSFIGPIPIQLIVGILIAKKYGPKPPDKPWDEDTEPPESSDEKLLTE
ncbi:MAG: hypothetical protein ACTSSE_13960 [Candidatus Thorarchaeota archaeon]